MSVRLFSITHANVSVGTYTRSHTVRNITLHAVFRSETASKVGLSEFSQSLQVNITDYFLSTIADISFGRDAQELAVASTCQHFS